MAKPNRVAMGNGVQEENSNASTHNDVRKSGSKSGSLTGTTSSKKRPREASIKLDHDSESSSSPVTDSPEEEGQPVGKSKKKKLNHQVSIDKSASSGEAASDATLPERNGEQEEPMEYEVEEIMAKRTTTRGVIQVLLCQRVQS